MKNCFPVAIDFRYLLLENYKKMNLDEKDISVIFMIDYLLAQRNSILTADLLALKMTMPSKEIDSILGKLVKNKIISLDISKSGAAKMSIKPLKSKLENILKTQLLKETNQADDEFVGNIYHLLEKELARPLSPVEMARIQEWFAISYSEEMIINAIKDVKKERKLSIRGVDEMLLKKSKSEDLTAEGYSVKSDKWDKNLKETIAITKTKWLNEDE